MKRNYKFRADFFPCLLFVVGVLIGHPVFLHAHEQERRTTVQDSQEVDEHIIKADRGRIFSRRGWAIVQSAPVKSLAAQPALIEDPEATVRRLAGTIKLDEESALRNLTNLETGLVWIKRHLDESEVVALQALKIPGLDFRSEARRHYSRGKLAAHVLGPTDIDQKGLGGVELQFDQDLSGRDGYVVDPRNGLSQSAVSNSREGRPAVAGNSLILTIDLNIQGFLEKAIAEAVLGSKPVSICGVVMDPRTGEVLAMASFPDFDPKDPERYPLDVRQNRVLTDTFEPGSLIKPLVIAAALENGAVTPESEFFCENSVWQYRSRTIRDCRDYGTLTVDKVIRESSNIGAVKIGLKLQALGNEQERNILHEVLVALGFGAKLGIDLPDEAGGRVTPHDKWSWFTDTSVPMGYQVSVTPLQMVSAYSCLANGGLLMKPYVVSEIVDSSGITVRKFEPELLRRVYSKKTTDVLRETLSHVEQDGVAGRVSCKYSVAGQTATTRKLTRSDDGYSDKYYASFVAFAPVTDPRLCVFVSVNEPSGPSYFGGTVAAPLVKDVIAKTLCYLE